MNRQTALSLLLLIVMGAADGAEMTIRGQVVDDNGNAIVGAVIDARLGNTVSDADGRFELRLSADQPVALHIDADGYYATIHSFAPEDLDVLDGEVGPVAIVARKPNRRLLLFAGDAMLARRYFEPPAGEATLMRKGHELEDGKAILATIKPYIELADYASVNMETQLSSRKLSDRLPKSVTFWSPAEFAEILEWAGFDYAALGNNHTWDYQGEGLQTTFAALEETNLGYSGAGFDETAARAPWSTELGGRPFAFLSYVGWAGTFSPHQAAEADKGGAALGGSEVFAEDLAQVPSSTAAVLQYHSGLEYSGQPAMSERMRLREAVDAGADVVIGHHAHVLQGLEVYKDRLIAYSMGNFLFDQTFYTTQLGMLLYAWVDDDRLYRAEVVPMYVNGYVPTPATGTIRQSILHRVARLSQPLGTCLQQNAAHAVVAPCDESKAQRVDLGEAQPGGGPVPLDSLGVRPAEPVSLSINGFQYRLGTNILFHGDFDSAGLYGTPERGWLLSEQVSIEDGDSRYLNVTVPADEALRTGMNSLQRVFTRSNPTTLSGRVRADGPAVIRFQIQRRRPGMTTSEALASGPTMAIGSLRTGDGEWRRFSFDVDQPRVSTDALRLLIEVADDPAEPGGVAIQLDDLTWIEWRTPWLDQGGSGFGTHVQFRPAP